MPKIFKVIFSFMLVTYTLFASSFLMPDQAFKPYAKVNDAMQIIAGIKLGEDIYLYDERLKIRLKKNDTFAIASIKKPTPVEHNGDKVYLKSPQFIITLKKLNKQSNGIKDVVVEIAYQGCSELGLCYEPSKKSFTLQIDSAKLGANLEQKNVKNISQTDKIAQTMQENGIFIVLATFFVFGLLLSLTPCVFPMIPIISGVIISQGKGITTKKAFMLSLVYVLAMAVAYTIAGVLAGLFGSNMQAALQTPWVVYAFSGVFVALAFSMFGFYELKLPDALVTKVSGGSSRSGYIGVAIMGFLSALIVGPCVAAPLAGALVYIGQTGDALLGGMALFSMSLGMGVPLIVVGVSAGKFMPKPGAWMTLVNATFGVMMLGVAIWMLEKVVAFDIVMLLYALLGIGFSLYLGAFERGGHIVKHATAVILFIYSVALFVGFLGGSSSMLKPLAFMQNTTQGSSFQKGEALHFQTVHSIEALDALLQKNKGKKILLDFSAQWCSSCKELESITFADPRVQKALASYVLIRADVTKNTPQEKALSKKYGVFGPPALLFFDTNAALVASKTIIGFIEPDQFLKYLD